LWRVYLCFLGIIVLGIIILGRAIYIQRVQGAYWKTISDAQQLKYKDINAERGSIYSEDGNMLSTSIPVFDIYVDFDADGLREKDGKSVSFLKFEVDGTINMTKIPAPLDATIL